MKTYEEALAMLKAYSPRTGWSDEEQAEFQAFFRQATPAEQEALREIRRQKTEELLASSEQLIDEIERELKLSKSPQQEFGKVE
jgi:hypothetical protein